MKDSGGTIRRWLDYIQEFNFTVPHSAGKYNSNKEECIFSNGEIVPKVRNPTEQTRFKQG